MTTPTLNPPASLAPAADIRISQLAGDRPCAKCHFNLSGQTIVREPHYNLLIIRCPECGTAASLQEYPTLGRWAPRLAYLIAAVWLLLLLLGAAFTAGATAIITYGSASELAEPFQDFAYRAALEHETTTQSKFGPPPPNANPYASFDQDWWNALPPSKLFADAGGWFNGGIDWNALWFWYFIVIIGMPVGMVWSIALPQARLPRFALITLLIIALATLMLAPSHFSGTSMAWGGVWQARELAFKLVFWPLGALSLAFCALCLFLGMLLGRRTARLLVCFFLPSRLWPAFSYLWFADNRPLPRPR